MAMTGHNSGSSLSVYQKVDEQEKLEMGSSLGNYVANKNNTALVENELDDLVLDDWNFDIEYFPTNNPISIPSRSSCGSSKLSNFPYGLFNNCNINNLHIHLPK